MRDIQLILGVQYLYLNLIFNNFVNDNQFLRKGNTL